MSGKNIHLFIELLFSMHFKTGRPDGASFLYSD